MFLTVMLCHLQAAQAQILANIPSLDFAPAGFSTSQKVRALQSPVNAVL